MMTTRISGGRTGSRRAGAPGARTGVALALVLGLSACGGGNPLSNMFGGDKPADGVAVTLPRPNPDSRGVITYANYQVMVARDGDTVASMASRVGLDPNELARHNGLPPTYAPRPGEQLALPRNVGGTPATVQGGLWNTQIAATAIDSASSSGVTSAPLGAASPVTGSATAATEVNPFSNGQASPVIDPVRHRVRPGETAFSIARTYGVSVKALAEWNGLGADMGLRADQELLIPVRPGETARGAVERPQTQVAAVNAPGTPTPIAPPPSAQAPLPEDQDIDAAQVPPSPALGEQRTAASGGAAPAPAPAPAAAPAASARFGYPVAGGRVLRGYDPNGATKNEGIDFAAAAGAPVVAAGDGEVALISESLGGLGTIVLIRHPGNLMTVYGRVTDVALEKGDAVRKGQRIGAVAGGDQPNVHFEVRQGTDSVDPRGFLGG